MLIAFCRTAESSHISAQKMLLMLLNQKFQLKLQHVCGGAGGEAERFIPEWINVSEILQPDVASRAGKLFLFSAQLRHTPRSVVCEMMDASLKRVVSMGHVTLSSWGAC